MTMKLAAIVVAAGLLGTACAKDEPGVEGLGGPGNPQGPIAVAAPASAQMPDSGNDGAAGMTAAYLAGPWCYAYMQVLGQPRHVENVDHVFNEDGTFKQSRKTFKPQSWRLDGSKLFIHADAYVPAKEIYSVEQDRFVLGSTLVQAVFERGACPKGEPA